jgi:hypothetical protein
MAAPGVPARSLITNIYQTGALDGVRTVDEIEEFWSDLLSEEPLRIVAAWLTLTAEEKVVIHAHLMKMAVEDGWAEVQRAAAQAALYTIDEDEAPTA